MNWFDLNGDEEEMYLAFLFVGGKYLVSPWCGLFTIGGYKFIACRG
jgi:hypothetical protein